MPWYAEGNTVARFHHAHADSAPQASALDQSQTKVRMLVMDAMGHFIKAIGEEVLQVGCIGRCNAYEDRATDNNINLQEKIHSRLMSALHTRWSTIGDDDRQLIPLLEYVWGCCQHCCSLFHHSAPRFFNFVCRCFQDLVMVIGPKFERYAPPVLSRCLKVVEDTLLETEVSMKAALPAQCFTAMLSAGPRLRQCFIAMRTSVTFWMLKTF